MSSFFEVSFSPGQRTFVLFIARWLCAKMAQQHIHSTIVNSVRVFLIHHAHAHTRMYVWRKKALIIIDRSFLLIIKEKIMQKDAPFPYNKDSNHLQKNVCVFLVEMEVDFHVIFFISNYFPVFFLVFFLTHMITNVLLCPLIVDLTE